MMTWCCGLIISRVSTSKAQAVFHSGSERVDRESPQLQSLIGLRQAEHGARLQAGVGDLVDKIVADRQVEPGEAAPR